MPRARKIVADDVTDQELPLDGLDADPTPRATRGRPRKTTAKGVGSRGRIPARTAAGRVMSHSAMVAKVSEEVYMYLSLAAAGFELRDPECVASLYEPVTVPGGSGPIEVERLRAIADRLVAMIARNKGLLEMAAKSGILGEIAVMLSLVIPVARTIWQAHGPSGTGHRPAEEVVGDLNARYPAYAG